MILASTELVTDASDVGVSVVGRPGPQPGRDDSGGHGQYHPEEDEDQGDEGLVVVVLEVVLDAVVLPSHVAALDVPQEVVGGAKPRTDAAGQQNGHHLHACVQHMHAYIRYYESSRTCHTQHE